MSGVRAVPGLGKGQGREIQRLLLRLSRRRDPTAVWRMPVQQSRKMAGNASRLPGFDAERFMGKPPERTIAPLELDDH